VRWRGLSVPLAGDADWWFADVDAKPTPPFPAGAAGLGALVLGLCSPRHLGDGNKAPCICPICLGSWQRNVRRELLVLQKVPLSSQAASHLFVGDGDGDGGHPWYMMLRRFSSRSARKWADLAARVKKVVAVLSIGFVRVARDWWGVWSLGSVSSTPGEHCIEYSRGELGNDVRGGAVHVIFGVTVLPETMRPVKVAMKVDLLILKMLRCPAVEQVASMKARWAFKPGAA